MTYSRNKRKKSRRRNRGWIGSDQWANTYAPDLSLNNRQRDVTQASWRNREHGFNV